MSPPTSTCVVQHLPARTRAASSTARRGATRLDLPLVSATFLTGDILPRRCSGGTNPGGRCTTLGADPACTGGGTCVTDSGPRSPARSATRRRSSATAARTTAWRASPTAAAAPGCRSIPTSHDCTVSTLVLVGDLPVPVPAHDRDVHQDRRAARARSSACSAASAATRTAPAPSASAPAASTTAWPAPSPATARAASAGAKPCESDADCTATPRPRVLRAAQRRRLRSRRRRQHDHHRDRHAVGQRRGLRARTPGTVVSVFCIPPTFNAIIDASADLPGPGAVSLPSTIQLVSPSGAFVDSAAPF